ncbi:glycoside hydrolase [Dacryopinax primogenitus]|uniref:Glycoside hydrolase n=1 Tax=Dacryopinax primogenitus (strain DJM 731) TaxID=1858805 RepID=M5G505_DACPD|nr:glycoside hydrolase [Dacryopinax primogenitus]EJU03305.1 glycoside hydrolase [Dacryopinax primogenitus]
MRLPFSTPYLSPGLNPLSDQFSFLGDTCRLACRFLSVCCKDREERTRWVTISPIPGQTINGIGVSGAWWPLDLQHFPVSQQEKVAELLFSKDTGLGLSSYRYNIGGGGKGVGNPSRRPPTPYVAPGVYNFTADTASNFFLRAAASYGVEQLTAFVNSAPADLTSNGDACGGMMSKENVPAFSKYLADVLVFWQEEGVRFDLVSPMNEPDNNFANLDGSPCRQEGMAVLPALRASLPSVLRRTLDAAGLSHVGILADETSTVPEFLPEIPLWLPLAKAHIAAVAHHDYLFADERSLTAMGVEGRALSGGKDMWFTEICCFKTREGEREGDPLAPLAFGQTYDPTIVGALQLGVILYKSFTLVGDTHFDWWTAVSKAIGCSPFNSTTCATTINRHGYNDGLLYYDPSFNKTQNYEIYTTKRFFLLKHFARFIPIGSVRYDVFGSAPLQRVLAFKRPARGAEPAGWTVVVMNMSDEESAFEIELYVEMGRATAAYRTTAEEDWVDVPLQGDRPGEGRFHMLLPGLSITTVLFE